METMKSYSTLKNKSEITSIAVGGFDGMHKAHQELFQNLDKNGAIVVIESGYANITPKTYRQEYTHFPIFYYLLESIKHLNGEQFIHLIKEEFPNLKDIIVGYDFCFGANRKHCIKDLAKLFSGRVKIVEEVTLNNISIHSRVIRDYIKNGDMITANLLLSKNYKIKGQHIQGQGLGSTQFVPTINLKVSEFVLPNEGVYATKTIVNNTTYNSVSFLGHRITTDNSYAIETHILDNTIEKVSKNIELIFIDKIRDNQKFDNFDDLKKQILIDIKNTKYIFNRSKKQ